MKVKEIKEFTEVTDPLLTIEEGAPLTKAIGQMAAGRYGAITATRNGKYAGVLTERMLLKNVIAKGKDVSELSLKDVVSNDVPTIELETDAQEVLDEMDETEYRHVPVLDKDGRMVGMLCQDDFVAYTWPQATARMRETAQIGVTHAYQPFTIMLAVIAYTVLVAGLAVSIW